MTAASHQGDVDMKDRVLSKIDLTATGLVCMPTIPGWSFSSYDSQQAASSLPLLSFLSPPFPWKVSWGAAVECFVKKFFLSCSSNQPHSGNHNARLLIYHTRSCTHTKRRSRGHSCDNMMDGVYRLLTRIL
jgi:hypothetical protein